MATHACLQTCAADRSSGRAELQRAAASCTPTCAMLTPSASEMASTRSRTTPGRLMDARAGLDISSAAAASAVMLSALAMPPSLAAAASGERFHSSGACGWAVCAANSVRECVHAQRSEGWRAHACVECDAAWLRQQRAARQLAWRRKCWRAHLADQACCAGKVQAQRGRQRLQAGAHLGRRQVQQA